MTVEIGQRRRTVLLRRALRFGVLPLLGAAPIVAIGIAVGAIIVVALLTLHEALFVLAGLVVLALEIVAAAGFVVAVVLVWFSPTRPLAVGYLAGTVIAVLIVVIATGTALFLLEAAIELQAAAG